MVWGALGVFVLLALLNVTGMFFHVRGEESREWRARSFSGSVVAVSPGILKVKDIHDRQRLFRLNEETIIHQGKDVVLPAALLVGSHVVIEASREGGGEIARTIRIVVSTIAKPKK